MFLWPKWPHPWGHVLYFDLYSEKNEVQHPDTVINIMETFPSKVLLTNINSLLDFGVAMLSPVQINSHSQASKPGSKGPLV